MAEHPLTGSISRSSSWSSDPAIVVPLMLAVAYLPMPSARSSAAIAAAPGAERRSGRSACCRASPTALKLFLKETIIPTGANKVVFLIAPIITFTLALIGWAVIPFDDGVVLADINVGLLYLFAISSLGVYGIIMAGWASNSRYAFLGALRSAAQMVSYEVVDRLRS